MDLQEFLNRPQKLLRIIENRTAELEKLYKLSLNSDLDLKAYKSLKEDLDVKLLEYAEASKNLHETLEILDPIEYDIIYSKYIKGLTMEEIADKVMYCRRQTYRYHNNAVKKLEGFINDWKNERAWLFNKT